MRNITYVGIIIFCHGLYHLTRFAFNFEHVTTTVLIYLINFELFYWVPAIIFEVMDRGGVSNEFKLKYKLKEIPTKITTLEMMVYSVLNHLLQHLFIISLIYLLLGSFNDTSISTLFWLLVMYFVHDFIFFVGHFLMHKWTWLYKKIHKLHHLTYATRGISAHYMNFFDFVLESISELSGAIIICFPFNGSPISFICFSTIAVFNGVVVHSGYDLPLLPSPKRHYIHHTKFNCNYSIGPCDTLFSTNKEFEVDEKIDQLK
eukprot:gene3845-7005_t